MNISNARASSSIPTISVVNGTILSPPFEIGLPGKCIPNPGCNLALDNRTVSVCFDADPDVAGIGIIISFIASVTLTYCMLLFAYLFVEDSIAKMFWNRLDDFLSFGKRKWAKDCFKGEYMVKALRTSALALGDQQLFFSVGILCVGFAKSGQMSQYHFDLIVNSAWLASTTFGTTLLLTSNTFVKSENQMMNIWRAVLASFKFGLLIVGQTITYNRYWLRVIGLPTSCVFSKEQNTAYRNPLASAQMSMAITFMVLAYYTEMRTLLTLKICNSINIWGAVIVLSPWRLHDSLKKQIKTQDVAWKRRMLFVSNLFVTPFAYAAAMLVELCCSTSFILMRTLVTGVWASTLIFRLRFISASKGLIGNENELGFGQILPLLLLLSPLFAIIEIFSEKRRKSLDKTKENSVESSESGAIFGTPSTSGELTAKVWERWLQYCFKGLPLRRRLFLKRASTLELMIRGGNPGLRAKGEDAETPPEWLTELYRDGIIEKFYSGWFGRIQILLVLTTVAGVPFVVVYGLPY
ncbi:hypothetical protein H072_3401 [Dactylellina haptotyla CBS 200.50]|uniref:Uncharacterized protein n=1 Tax=Dactylellina haptotyla (strain CBS 200.50) TaxID=1284197 RepID=S8BSV2_DACHA|nr:hypothetical protein H072_3401 [Dactylellina haptotyla CBS 200.50]